MEENDKILDENKKMLVDMFLNLEGDMENWNCISDSFFVDESDNIIKIGFYVYRNSIFLIQFGVLDDFGVVNIWGYVGEEEVE